MKREPIEAYYVENLMRYTKTEIEFCESSEVRELEAYTTHIERREENALSMLSMYGVTKERARTVDNGIEVLITRIRKESMCTAHHISDLESRLEIYEEMVEEILYCETISHEVNCIVLGAKDALAKLKENEE